LSDFTGEDKQLIDKFEIEGRKEKERERERDRQTDRQT
jgi:hypothetical protein